jgi:glycogen operon protein
MDEPFTQTQTQKTVSPGTPEPLGATLTAEGVNFAIFSEYAQEVYLCLYDQADATAATDTIRIRHQTDHVWHIHVKGIGAGQLYGYKVNGPYEPKDGKRFNPHKLLMDPYAKALTHPCVDQNLLLFAYDTKSPQKDLVMDTRANDQIVPKSIVIDDAFDWQQDKPPDIPLHELIIYETHVKGFTAHASSKVKNAGTYLGMIEKIQHLKELGVNAVELMPVHQFFFRNELLDKGLTDFWGYNSIAFFAPEVAYSTRSEWGCQVEEFKTLVRELHRAGIEVILDVVFNHTGEGNELGPTVCFKGVDNPTYYALVKNPEEPDQPYRHYLNDTGCGNTLNIEHPVVMRMVLDSLRYWAQVMHVDGFRFDLASILARVKGEFDESSKFFEAISRDPVLQKVKMIAEPWDLTTYQVGNFPQGWSEWNGKFRDTARRFLKGDEGQMAEVAKRITGSADLYQEDGRGPQNSINFITCHDGFTLHDLYAYNQKHNEGNFEDNLDGSDDNLSWNCGVEGETDDKRIIRFRKQMVKNALCCLFFSSGTPMLLYGDEILRSQRGNNNAYCQDNELTWFDWGLIKANADINAFCQKAIRFRKKYAVLRNRRFFTGQDTNQDQIPDISWFGKHLDRPRWESVKCKTFAYMLAGNEDHARPEDYYLFFIYNMYHRGAVIDLPQQDGFQWYRVVDTSRRPGDDFRNHSRKKRLRNQRKHYCKAYCVHVLVGGHTL